MIVADCNLLAYLLIDGAFTKLAEAVFLQDPEWSAPYLWRSEFRNVLASHIRYRSMTLSDAQQTMGKAEQIMRHAGLSVDSDQVLQETAGTGISAYDAEYIVLARRLSIPFVTADRKLLAAAPAVACSPSDFLQAPADDLPRPQRHDPG